MWRSGGRQVDVQGLSGSVLAISTGLFFSCSLMVKGTSTVERQGWVSAQGWRLAVGIVSGERVAGRRE